MSQILSDFIRDRDFFYRKDFTDIYKLDESISSITNLVTRVLAKFVKERKLLVSDRKSNSLQYMVIEIKTMKTNLKENIWIEGFDTEKHKNSLLDTWYKEDELLWHGKTSEISEELAKQFVQRFVDYKDYSGENTRVYDYIDSSMNDSERKLNWIRGGRKTTLFWHLTAKKSIQSACNKPYCIIYKTE